MNRRVKTTWITGGISLVFAILMALVVAVPDLALAIFVGFGIATIVATVWMTVDMFLEDREYGN